MPDDIQPQEQEVKEWQTEILSLTSQLQEAKDRIKTLEDKGQPGLTPEMEAVRDQVVSLSTELQEAKTSLAEAQQELSQMRQSRKSVEEDNLTQETPTETLSAPTEVQEKPPVAQTRASRLGWLK